MFQIEVLNDHNNTIRKKRLTNNLQILTENPPPSQILILPDSSFRAQPRPPTPARQHISQNKTIQCLILVTTFVVTVSNDSVRQLPVAYAPVVRMRRIVTHDLQHESCEF